MVHDGRAATTAGFRKRVLYLDPDVVDPALVGRAVDEPTIADRELAGRGGLAARRPGRAACPRLEADTRLALVAERLAAHLRGTPHRRSTPRPSGAGLADAARDVLDDDPSARLGLADLGRAVGSSPTHLVRAFTRRFGVPPHAYVVGRRVDAARRMLLAGVAPADVAVAVGLPRPGRT